MISRLLKTIILGPPGSGKGTISQRIVKDFGMKHLSSGDILRQHIRNETVLGLKVKEYITNGCLVPDDVMIQLISDELNFLSGSSWLLDGFPRTVPQAEILYQRCPVDVVINLNVPFEVIVNRIKGRLLHPASGRIYHTEFNPPKVSGKDDHTGDDLIQRLDDEEQTVKARLQSYSEQTQPVIDFYKELGILAEFTGSKSNELWPLIHKFLSSKVGPLQYTQYSG